MLEAARFRLRSHLQLVLSMLRMQLRKAASDDARSALEDAIRRSEAVVLIEQRSGEGSATIRLDSYLQALAEPLAALLAARGIGFELDLAPVELHPEAAVSLGLLVNEAVTNALKHAFADGRKGCVRLLTMPADDQLKVLIADDGVGLPDGVLDRQADGSGVGLIQRVARQIGGELLIERTSGTSYLITLPVRSQGAAALAPEPARPLPPQA